MVRKEYSSSSPSREASPAPSRPTSKGEESLFNTLRKLHSDEIAFFVQKGTSVPVDWENSFMALFVQMCKAYVTFIWTVWTRAAWSIVFLPTTSWDRTSIVVMAALATTVMNIIFVWCILSNVPGLTELFDGISRKYLGGLSAVNALYPTIFEELTDEQVAVGKQAMSKPIGESKSTADKRVFELDIAKVLLQCASLMYERSSKPTRHAIAVAHNIFVRNSPRAQSSPNGDIAAGNHLSSLLGLVGAREVENQLQEDNGEEDKIQSIAFKSLGLNYRTISELNSTGSSYCGLFWDPNETFIVVAFRGTSPTDFMEWSTDFTFSPVSAGQWLRGFGKVHGGFHNKIYPRKLSPGARMPYDTISKAVQEVSATLLINKPGGTKINIFVTGHSLGCALASLVYSRFINEPKTCGPNTVIRDAFLFAAPIVCDRDSVTAFNNRMNHFESQPRTLWRVTNARDAVATLLPDQGDRPEYELSPYNMFTFAHLGAEIRMRTKPSQSVVVGSHITQGTRVVIHSDCKNVEEHVTDEVQKRREAMLALQNIPLIGRIISHATGCYWLQLQTIGSGHCNWEEY